MSKVKRLKPSLKEPVPLRERMLEACAKAMGYELLQVKPYSKATPRQTELILWRDSVGLEEEGDYWIDVSRNLWINIAHFDPTHNAHQLKDLILKQRLSLIAPESPDLPWTVIKKEGTQMMSSTGFDLADTVCRVVHRWMVDQTEGRGASRASGIPKSTRIKKAVAAEKRSAKC